MEKLDMSTLKSTASGVKEGRPAHMGEKIAGWLILAMVVYLFIAQ